MQGEPLTGIFDIHEGSQLGKDGSECLTSMSSNLCVKFGLVRVVHLQPAGQTGCAR